MKSITDLQKDLIAVYEGLRSRTMEAKEAQEINNTAGKIIAISKVQIAYHALRNESPVIPFLAAPVEPKPTPQLSESAEQAA